MKQTILITGSQGLCGKNLVSYFQQKYRVVSIDRKDKKGVGTIKHDLKYPISSSSFSLPIDCILHFAAMIDQEGKDPDRMMKNNLLSTYNILDFAVKKKVERFIYASSSAIYTKPPSLYGLSKYLGEQIVNAFGEIYSLPITIFRLGYVVGSPLPKRYFLYKIIKKMKSNQPITLENPKNTFSFIYAEDIAQFCEKAFISKINGTYNLTGIPKTISETAFRLRKKLKSQSEFKTLYKSKKINFSFDISETQKKFKLKFRDPFDFVTNWMKTE